MIVKSDEYEQKAFVKMLNTNQLSYAECLPDTHTLTHPQKKKYSYIFYKWST